jgi:arabinogalactan endo-1,4-beta-galactosidase
MLRRLRRCVALVGVVGATAVLPAAASGAAAVPQGFVGVNLDTPLYPTPAAGVNASAQYRLMEQSGVESVRAAFSWQYAQPYASFAQVPAAQRSQFVDVGGVPTRFGQMDALMEQAAKNGMSVLPTVLYAPNWDATGAAEYQLPRPARDGPYAAFLTALVHRYGPGGSFWKSHRYPTGIPITRWQIWNEEDRSYDWPAQPFAPTYVALLKASSRAIKRADPSAQVVLGGLTNFSWTDLATIYKVPGARSAFDIVAAHPYTADPDGVITILQNIRQVMDKNGDSAKPLIVSEFGWASSQGHVDQSGEGVVGSTTEQGQAADVAALLPMLAQDRTSLRIVGFDYYTWASTPQEGSNFSYSGLFGYSGRMLHAKPVYSAFRTAALAMEGCRVKGSVASVCAQR